MYLFREDSLSENRRNKKECRPRKSPDGISEFDCLHIASPIQIYLDLVGFRGRGEEAATAILEEVIQPQWWAEKIIRQKW